MKHFEFKGKKIITKKTLHYKKLNYVNMTHSVLLVDLLATHIPV